MKHVLSSVAAAWLLLAAAPLLAGDPLAEALTQAGVPAKDAQAVVERAATLGDAGVLATPVVNKVREGAAKGVPPAAIAAAALKLAGRMHESAGLYPGSAAPAVKTTAVEAAAKSMIAGCPPEAVRELFATLAAAPLARADWHRPLGALGALTAAGAGADHALAIVTGAIGLGLPPAGLTALPARFRLQLSSGRSPGDAADILLEELKGEKRDPVGRAGEGRGLDKDRGAEDGDGDSASIRGSGKVKYKDKSGRKKEPPGQGKK